MRRGIVKIDTFIYSNVLYHFIQKFLNEQENEYLMHEHTHTHTPMGEIPGKCDEGYVMSDTRIGDHKL